MSPPILESSLVLGLKVIFFSWKFKDLEFLSGPNVAAGLLSAGDRTEVSFSWYVSHLVFCSPSYLMLLINILDPEDIKCATSHLLRFLGMHKRIWHYLYDMNILGFTLFSVWCISSVFELGVTNCAHNHIQPPILSKTIKRVKLKVKNRKRRFIQYGYIYSVWDQEMCWRCSKSLNKIKV